MRTATKYYNESEFQTYNKSNYSNKINKLSNDIDDDVSHTYMDGKPQILFSSASSLTQMDMIQRFNEQRRNVSNQKGNQNTYRSQPNASYIPKKFVTKIPLKAIKPNIQLVSTSRNLPVNHSRESKLPVGSMHSY